MLIRTEIQRVRTDGAVLDVHFQPRIANQTRDRLCVATSTGIVELFDLVSSDPPRQRSSAFRVAPTDILVLSVAWHPRKDDLVAVSLSTGQVKVCHLNTGEGNPAADAIFDIDWGPVIHSHDLEAWTVVFNKEGSTIFSGGDDSILRCHSLLDNVFYSPNMNADVLTENADQSGPTFIRWIDRKAHAAGVTTILPLFRDVAITGSYDDRIRIVSTAHFKRRVLAERNLGGGVWRLKYIKGSESSDMAAEHANMRVVLLASCMYVGTRVVEVQKRGEDWTFEVLARFEEHKSMNYGSDVQPAKDQGKRTLISTSFYDKLLCLWHWRDAADEQSGLEASK